MQATNGSIQYFYEHYWCNPIEELPTPKFITMLTSENFFKPIKVVAMQECHIAIRQNGRNQ